MPKNQSQYTVEQQLRGIFPRRVALSVAANLDDLGVYGHDDLNTLRLPATHCTDLRHAAPKAVLRFEVWLNKYGAALVR